MLLQANLVDPGPTGHVITRSFTSQIVDCSPPPSSYAATALAEWRKLSPRTIIAQTMRALLLASATVVMFTGRRSSRPASHGKSVSPTPRRRRAIS